VNHPAKHRLVRYHLRIALDPRNWRNEERALWKVIRAAKINEVMFFVPHAEERSPGLGTDAENARMAAVLAPTFARLRRRGIEPSINIFWTVSFSNFPSLQRDLRKRFRFRWAVDVNGRHSIAAACPLDPAWRKQVQRMYRTYARLKPTRMWLDDDVRMTLRADMHSPCVCNVCLGEMKRRTGRQFTRGELVKAILADPSDVAASVSERTPRPLAHARGYTNPVRNAWLDFQEELERGIISELVRAIHEESPDTQIGFMFSPLEIHSAEGRRWEALIAALDTPRPFCRPMIGPYTEMTGLGIASALNATRLAQAALPPNVVLAPEIENYPHTRFTKSAALVRADMILGHLMGIHEMTFAVFRSSGRLDLELRRENVWPRTLAELKPMLQAIADLGITRDQARGVSLFWHEETCRHTRGVAGEPKPIFLYRERPWDQALPLLGIATRYGVGDVTALSGEQVDCLDDAALRSVFSRGVVLDARAAESLLLRGKGELAGVRRRARDVGVAIETIEDKAFGGITGDPMNDRWLGTAWQFEWMPGARIISRLRDFEGRRTGHGVVLFENSLGGRVAVLPFDGQVREVFSLGVGFPPLASPSFLCYTRQAQWRDVLEWLGRAPLPLFVPEAPSVYPLLVEQPGRLIVGVANLLADVIPSLKLRIRKPSFPIRRVRVLSSTGEWRICRSRSRSVAKGTLTIETGLAPGYLDVATLILE
jgi:hypothetical protein